MTSIALKLPVNKKTAAAMTQLLIIGATALGACVCAGLLVNFGKHKRAVKS